MKIKFEICAPPVRRIRKFYGFYQKYITLERPHAIKNNLNKV